MPTISVIISTYNRRPLLAEAVESVLAQSHADLELIIVDDGSTDDTDTYLQSVRLKDARVKPIYKSHIGNISRVFNVGVETAQGDWIAFLGSDDLWLPNKLKRQLDALSNAPECRWCYSDFTTIDEGGRPILRPSGKPFHPYSGWITHQLITFDATVASQTCLIAHDLLTQAGPFDPDVIHGQDYELLLRISLKGQAVPLNEALACVHLDHASQSCAD